MTNAEAEAYIGSLRDNPLYVGALTAISNARTGSVTEVSAAGYSRKAVTLGTSTTLSGNTGIQASNNGEILFDLANVDWGVIVGFALYSSLTGGTVKHINTLDQSKGIYISDQLKIAIGDLTITA